MQHASEGEGEGEAKRKKKPWSATQSRSHRGEEGLLVHGCALVFLTGKTARKGQEPRLIAPVWDGGLWGRDEEREQRGKL